MQKQRLILLVVTALVAWFIAVLLLYGTFSLVCAGIVCWVVLYWLWKWRDGRNTTRPFWRTVLRRTIILVAGALALFIFMISVRVSVWEIDRHHQVAMQLKTQINRARIEKNKVRIGMTINDVLPLVHVHLINASAVVERNKGFYAPDEFELVQHDDGTFTLSGHWLTERVLENLTDSQVAELVKQKMSAGYEWCWEYQFSNKLSPENISISAISSFRVTFGRDGRVKDITDVQGQVFDSLTHRT